MAVVINELEVVLEPPQSPPPPGGNVAVPQKPTLNPQDFLSIKDWEIRNRLRVKAH
jgi:hypothetical protein